MKDLKIEMNLKSIMLFEQLSGKSFYEMDTEDLPLLMYAIVSVNNPEYKLTYKSFTNTLSNKKALKKLAEAIQEELEYIQDISKMEMSTMKQDETEQEEETNEHIKISDIITTLIVGYGMSSHYVMYEMQIWEVIPFAQAVETKMRQDMENQRFWSYLQISPHIDSKKAGGPQKLIPFPWEKENNKNNEFINTNTDKIMDFFNKQNIKKNE